MTKLVRKKLTSYSEIANWLNKFANDGIPLTVDIETFDLKHIDAGIATIGFAWSEEEGIVFPVDMSLDKTLIRLILKDFFVSAPNTFIYHKASFDVYVLIYQLFMDHPTDMKGMLYGIESMLRNWEDTLYIAYLALNSCKRTPLDLKTLSAPFMGNYSQDIKEDLSNIRSIPPDKLLTYNLDDCRATWYVYNKYYPKMVADNQEDFYKKILKKGMANIIQMQLSGLPIHMPEVEHLQSIVAPERQQLIQDFESMPIVKRFILESRQKLLISKNQAYKRKVITLKDVKFDFNPGSPVHLRAILYGTSFFKLPVIHKTKTGNSSTKSDHVKDLLNFSSDPASEIFINKLLDLKATGKVHDTFIPAMLNATDTGKGYHLMFGGFNATGTVSGRLSSNNVNLQQIPSTGTIFAKPVKKCIRAPEGKILIGIDFDSLEDKVSALWTKDPNKLKIYTDGFDGHCLRAYTYFGDQMGHIDPNDVAAINAIAKLFPSLRQKSKAPTFLLTYNGTYYGLIKNCGFTKEEALKIEHLYHDLYIVSDEAVMAKIQQAAKDGYVTLAFGLRLRTPQLKRTIPGSPNTPYIAQKEARTAGNALGQSWGMLTQRAATEFMDKVRASIYATRITICAQIHDSMYFLTDNDIDIIMWVNEHLVKAIEWQNDPIIAHPLVKLSGKVALYHPTWAEETLIPNHISRDDLITLLTSASIPATR
ncbi:MAG: ribonuclease H-like domain-containing protein [Gammaproteobacteria bacterium]|nr:ribonuclease H-like domain-containing protein [Gammaproteobacteria bacterium]